MLARTRRTTMQDLGRMDARALSSKPPHVPQNVDCITMPLRPTGMQKDPLDRALRRQARIDILVNALIVACLIGVAALFLFVSD